MTHVNPFRDLGSEQIAAKVFERRAQTELNPDAVTNAKLANMAASTIKARKTASTGDPEDCTLSEVLDFIGSAAQGDILYRGATGWARLGAGSVGDVLTSGGAGANPAWAAAAGGSGGIGVANLLHVNEQQASGTNAGSSSAGSNTRVLNTTVVNNISGASRSGNQITLPAGTYWVELVAPAFNTDRARLGLYNVTDGALSFAGQVYYQNGAQEMSMCMAKGFITIASSKVFEIRQYLQSAFATYGLGLGYGTPGINEVFAEAHIWKI